MLIDTCLEYWSVVPVLLDIPLLGSLDVIVHKCLTNEVPDGQVTAPHLNVAVERLVAEPVTVSKSTVGVAMAAGALESYILVTVELSELTLLLKLDQQALT